MQATVVFRLVGILIILFSLSLCAPLLISLYYHDGAHYAFIKPIILMLIVGSVLAYSSSGKERDLRIRDGIIITISCWLASTLCGSLPFIFAPRPLPMMDAWFESMSGLTTTGATIMENISTMPISILFYRQFLQWLGGMGIILLVIAVLPVLGVGGMQLYRTEIPGPIKDTKLTPRITETAKLLWSIYIVLTLACIVAYKLAGMSYFDAISHSFSTVSIGGFSPHNENFGAFNNSAIQIVAIVFMLLASMNFTLHFYSWRFKSLKPYWNDSEWKFFILCMTAILVVTVVFWFPNIDGADSLIAALFQAVSIATTTGYTLENYNGFHLDIMFLLFAFACVGCCAGSVGGGIKMVRFLLMIKQGHRECKRTTHQNGIFNVRLGNNLVPDRVLESVWGFCSIYMISFFTIMALLLLTGADHITAWSATVASLNNLGPGLGDVSVNYASMGNAQKGILSFAMLLGRLEVFTLVVLLLPITWK